MFCGLDYSLGMGQHPGILVVHTQIAAENLHCPTQIVSQVAWPVSFLVQSSSFVVSIPHVFQFQSYMHVCAMLKLHGI